jgi:hypothetical protein
MKMGTQPVNVKIGNITLILKEHDELKRLPLIVQLEKEKDADYKRNFGTHVLENLEFEIDSMKIFVQLK